jgi:hypothetical protein
VLLVLNTRRSFDGTANNFFHRDNSERMASTKKITVGGVEVGRIGYGAMMVAIKQTYDRHVGIFQGGRGERLTRCICLLLGRNRAFRRSRRPLTVEATLSTQAVIAILKTTVTLLFTDINYFSEFYGLPTK